MLGSVTEMLNEGIEALDELLEGFIKGIESAGGGTASEESVPTNKGMDPVDSFWGEVQAFIHAIDWTEPWLIALMSFHVLTFATVLGSRNHTDFQFFLFLALIALCCATSQINDYAAKNYQKFASEQYFDSHGFFLVMVLAVPCLLNCCIMVAIWLRAVSRMLVTAKRGQLRERAREYRKTKNNQKKDGIANSQGREVAHVQTEAQNETPSRKTSDKAKAE